MMNVSPITKAFTLIALLTLFYQCSPPGNTSKTDLAFRERLSLNEGWYFMKYTENPDSLLYDIRPGIVDPREHTVADAKPTEASNLITSDQVLKAYILPTANPFIRDSALHHIRPAGSPGKDFPFVQPAFDDSDWQHIDLPHDWAINGPFMAGPNPEVGGGMGRLPSNGVGWYRKKIEITESDANKKIYLDIDGAMSYAMVWVNGHLAGGWPYGYNSFRIDLTPFVHVGHDNQLAIRIDNPNYSARWYPGGGIYRNVWLTKTNLIHVGHWGTFITTRNAATSSATIDLNVTVDNNSKHDADITVTTHIYKIDGSGNRKANKVKSFPVTATKIPAGKSTAIQNEVTIKHPKLWGPPPTQRPNLYVAVSRVEMNGNIVDEYETIFGIRSLEFDPNKGVLVNGERIQIKGVNQHHDLGALGAAFNVHAAERQLEILKEMGCNAIRMAHNPPAPELLDLTDRMGFLVFDEIFDSWELKKTPYDFHLIFPEWYEADTRSFIRRDRNHPSIIIWGMGNEVGEQYTGEEGAAVAKRLYDIIKEEDPTRPVTSAMNYAKPDMALPVTLDLISLNYQGEGIRQSPEFEGTERIRTPPMYDAFHKQFPNKLILSSETASAFSSRGVYLFPVTKEISDPVRDGRGGDSKTHQVSSYELHAVDFGSSADKVFASIESHPFVAGEFVWTGWDYIGEPTPYYTSRSSYCGIIDLAGFKKDRFYLYQSHWRPELPMAHILPHWNWPERIGKTTPVHVFTSGDEAELFLNGRSMGKRKKEKYQYRLRWDDVIYEPGEVKVVAYKDEKVWAKNKVVTTGQATKLHATADRNKINADGYDLSFISVSITDETGNVVPTANHFVTFEIEGPGEIVATDNGDATNMISFSSTERDAFNGWVLVIVKAKKGASGKIKLRAKAVGLKEAIEEINVD